MKIFFDTNVYIAEALVDAVLLASLRRLNAENGGFTPAVIR